MVLRGTLLPLDLCADRPDEAKQLAADGGGDLLPELALGHEAPVARAESVLRLPGDLLDLLARPSWRFLRRGDMAGRCWYAQAASPTMRRRWALPVLVIAPRRTLLPVESSLETMPL